jgi:simple sugar transport system permease protein
MMGHSRAAARQAGMSVDRLVLLSMAISGAIGGLAGASLVLGDRYRILDGISPGFGYIGILVALMALSSPLGAIAAAVLFAGLQLGGDFLEAGGHAPQAIILVIQGLVVLAVAGTAELQRRWKLSRAPA